MTRPWETVPSLDDKDTPSPPERTNAQYEWDKAHGINGPPYPTRRRGLELVIQENDSDTIRHNIRPGDMEERSHES